MPAPNVDSCRWSWISKRTYSNSGVGTTNVGDKLRLTKKQHNSFRSAALAIFAVALTLRLIHIWQIRQSPFFNVLIGDARGYDEWAQQIAGGDWIGHDVFYQAPLYPYFLGSIYWLAGRSLRSEEHTSELQSLRHLVCRLLLEKKNTKV